MKARHYFVEYRQFMEVCYTLTLCDCCSKQEDCAVYRMFYETKKAAWNSHKHSIRFELPECSEFSPTREARRFGIR